jgi:hypothetical protein
MGISDQIENFSGPCEGLSKEAFLKFLQDLSDKAPQILPRIEHMSPKMQEAFYEAVKKNGRGAKPFDWSPKQKNQ